MQLYVNGYDKYQFNKNVMVTLYTDDSREDVKSWYSKNVDIRTETPPDPSEEKLSEGNVYYDKSAKRMLPCV